MPEYPRIKSKLLRQLFRCCAVVQLLVLFLSPRDLLARSGLVETRDARSLRGHVRFTTNGITLINSLSQTITTIYATNLTELSLDPPTVVNPDILDLRAGRQPPPWQD